MVATKPELQKEKASCKKAQRNLHLNFVCALFCEMLNCVVQWWSTIKCANTTHGANLFTVFFYFLGCCSDKISCVLILSFFCCFCGCGIDSETKKQLTESLVEAVLLQDVEEVRKTVAAGADVNWSRNGKTLVNVAALHGQFEILELLLDAGADADVATDLGVTPLIAATLCSEECAMKIIEYGVNLDARNSRGTTALILSVTYHLQKLAKKLIASGADVNVQTNGHQTTALMMASHNELLEVAQSLISHGADVDTVDAHGKTAMDYAKTPEMKKLLGEKGNSDS